MMVPTRSPDDNSVKRRILSQASERGRWLRSGTLGQPSAWVRRIAGDHPAQGSREPPVSWRGGWVLWLLVVWLASSCAASMPGMVAPADSALPRAPEGARARVLQERARIEQLKGRVEGAGGGGGGEASPNAPSMAAEPDGAFGSEAPAPDIGSGGGGGCQTICEAAEAICSSQATICEIAVTQHTLEDVQQTCHWAQGECAHANSTCQDCRGAP